MWFKHVLSKLFVVDSVEAEVFKRRHGAYMTAKASDCLSACGFPTYSGALAPPEWPYLPGRAIGASEIGNDFEQ